MIAIKVVNRSFNARFVCANYPLVSSVIDVRTLTTVHTADPADVEPLIYVDLQLLFIIHA